MPLGGKKKQKQKRGPSLSTVAGRDLLAYFNAFARLLSRYLHFSKSDVSTLLRERTMVGLEEHQRSALFGLLVHTDTRPTGATADVIVRLPDAGA